jgi:hypothetical protein
MSRKPSRKRATKWLRCDQVEADPPVVRLFKDLRRARYWLSQDINDEDRDLMQWYEREAWTYLMQYMATLEVPERVMADI